MQRIRSVLLLARFPPDYAGGALQASRLMEKLSEQGVEMQVLSTLPEDGRGARRERAFGGAVRRFRVFGGVSAREMMLSLRAGWWLLTHSGWDLLHCSGFSYHAVLPLLVAKLKGKPVLIKTTVLGSDGAFNPGGNPLARRLLGVYARADVIVALSQALEDDLRGRDEVRARILQIPNGVDTRHFSPDPNRAVELRKRMELPQDAFLVVCVAMLYPRKNVLALVHAAARMKTRPVCIALAGPPGPDGAYLGELHAAIESLPEGVSVRLLGALEAPELQGLLRAADAFALVSRAEGLPNALLEAMSTGAACVATDIPGSADVLAKGGGLLVPLDDDPALAHAFDTLAADPSERRRLGEEARSLALERYSFESVAARYREVYDSLLTQDGQS